MTKKPTAEEGAKARVGDCERNVASLRDKRGAAAQKLAADRAEFARRMADGGDVDAAELDAQESRLKLYDDAIRVADEDLRQASGELARIRLSQHNAEVARVERSAENLGEAIAKAWTENVVPLLVQVPALQAEYDRARRARRDKDMNARIVHHMATPHLAQLLAIAAEGIVIDVTVQAGLALTSPTVQSEDTADALRTDANALERIDIAHGVDRETTARDTSESAMEAALASVAQAARTRVEQAAGPTIERFEVEVQKIEGEVDRFVLAQRPEGVTDADAARLAERSADAFVKHLDRQPADHRPSWDRQTLFAAAERDDRFLIRGVYDMPFRDQYGIDDALLDEVARRHAEIREPEKVARLDELGNVLAMLRFNRATALRRIGYAPIPEVVLR